MLRELKLRQASCIVLETAAAQLESNAVVPPIESKYIVDSRICVTLMQVQKLSDIHIRLRMNTKN